MSKLAITSNFRTDIFGGLAAILGDDGVMLSDIGYDASDAQRDYSQHIAEAMIRSADRKEGDASAMASVMLASADTGTGKTLGYGVPLLLKAAMNRLRVGDDGPQVAIATHSHALQKQFMGTPDNPGDIVKISNWVEAIGLPKLKIARRVGMQAFVSLSAFTKVAQQLREKRIELGITALDLQLIEPIGEFAADANEGKSSGLIEDLKELLGGSLPFNISAASICLGSDSDVEDRAAYELHLVKAHEADVLIISHAYLAACALYKSGNITPRGIDCLVVDEADMLAQVAASTFRFEISLRRVSLMLQKIPGMPAKQAKSAMTAAADYAQSLHTAIDAVAINEIQQTSREQLTELVSVASGLIKKIHSSKTTPISQEVIDELSNCTVVMDRFIDQERKTELGIKDGFAAALSFSPVKNLPSLVVMPLNPGRIMSRIWNLRENYDGPLEGIKTSRLNCVVLTSATLGAPGHYSNPAARFKEVANSLGVSVIDHGRHKSELDLWCHFEPENFGAVKFVLADPAVPNPTVGVDEDLHAIISDQWMDYAVSMIAKACESGGRTLVLAKSYKDTQDLAERLLKRNVPVIEQMRGQSTADCIAQFLSSKSSVWISPTAWEGLNLPGAISNIVITRLPFQTLNSVDKALMRAYGNISNQGIESIAHAKTMNATKRKLRQGMMRAIRSRTDKSRIFIADPRFPMSAMSQIPLKHPKDIHYSGVRTYAALHTVVPARFQRALQNAEILKINGTVLR